MLRSKWRRPELLDLMFITADAAMAEYALSKGVNRIFVDLEQVGKAERQGHLDTVMSAHTIEDVRAARAAIGKSPLLVRSNPWHPGSVVELESIVDAGADFIMIPMVASAEHVMQFDQVVNGRVPFVPLVETPEGIADIARIASLDCVTEVYVGLNDLHLALGLSFMFELLADGTVDRAVSQVKAEGKRFGFGGVGRMGQDALPGERVIAEHVRLGSSSVILSRSFHQRATSVDELEALGFDDEIRRLRDFEAHFANRTPEQEQIDFNETARIINEFAESRRNRASG